MRETTDDGVLSSSGMREDHLVPPSFRHWNELPSSCQLVETLKFLSNNIKKSKDVKRQNVAIGSLEGWERVDIKGSNYLDVFIESVYTLTEKTN